MQRMGLALRHLNRYHDGHNMLPQIVTGDESWVHHYQPETKRASMQWKHLAEPPGSDNSPKNFMLLVFRGLWNDGTSASLYREIMLRNKSILQISTLICLSSISNCNLLIDSPSYFMNKITNFFLRKLQPWFPTLRCLGKCNILEKWHRLEFRKWHHSHLQNGWALTAG
jgi:hypothetical protein